MNDDLFETIEQISENDNLDVKFDLIVDALVMIANRIHPNARIVGL